MSVDSIGNFLTIIRNGIHASRPFVYIPHSKMGLRVIEILKEEGFLRDFQVEEVDGFKKLKVLLKYFEGASVIHQIQRESKPGRRKYTSKYMTPVIGGLGIAILTTSKGVMTDKQAKDLALGGEVICTVW